MARAETVVTRRGRPLTPAERAARGDYVVRNRADLDCACGGLLAEDDNGHVFCTKCEGE